MENNIRSRPSIKCRTPTPAREEYLESSEEYESSQKFDHYLESSEEYQSSQKLNESNKLCEHESPNSSDLLQDRSERIEREINNYQQLWSIALSVVLLLAWLVFMSKSSETQSVQSVHSVLDVKQCSLQELKKNYPQNENAWLSLSTGIEIILNGERDSPAVYLFLHNDSFLLNEIVSKIAHEASLCFGNKKHVQLDSFDFSTEEVMEDYGVVVEKYKQKIKEQTVILIVELDKIPAEAARALHPICDTYSPLVKYVVILMTLNTRNFSGNALETAENTFYELWSSKIDRDSLDPLITRLMDQVIALK